VFKQTRESDEKSRRPFLQSIKRPTKTTHRSPETMPFKIHIKHSSDLELPYQQNY